MPIVDEKKTQLQCDKTENNGQTNDDIKTRNKYEWVNMVHSDFMWTLKLTSPILTLLRLVSPVDQILVFFLSALPVSESSTSPVLLLPLPSPVSISLFLALTLSPCSPTRYSSLVSLQSPAQLSDPLPISSLALWSKPAGRHCLGQWREGERDEGIEEKG